ncbi:MAG: D-aminoacylase [Blastocatellia bacterium]|nr:D-aminoacylase [Blastocatellia bacterium]
MNSTFASFFTIVLVMIAAITAPAQVGPILIQNVTIIDGSGRAAIIGDVRISGERIVGVGRLKPNKSDRVIDGSGLAVAPGFIDIHNHSESGLLREGTAANQVSQGITTLMVGPDGGSPDRIGDYLKSIEGKVAVNVGAFMGHGTLRTLIMKSGLRREATPAETAAMIELLDSAMREGAFGLSSGLEYDAGFSANIDELIALSKVAAKYGGIYMTHMRDEEEGVLRAIAEALRIGREAKLPVQISHLKMGNGSVWGKSADAIALVNAARKAGQDVTADAYPYTAWASTITVLVPSRKHEDRAEVQKGIDAIGGPDKVLITSCRAFPAYEGKNLAEIAAMTNKTPVDVYIEIVKQGGAGVVGHGMTESDVKAFYQTPWVMVSSDGGIGSRHPRGTGTFTRVLGRFVRENKWLQLEEAVRKMTSMPAARLGLKDRGLIRKGMIADLVLFDPKTVIDRASFTEPQLISEGIRTVFVGGSPVWENGKITGSLPGKMLRHK